LTKCRSTQAAIQKKEQNQLIKGKTFCQIDNGMSASEREKVDPFGTVHRQVQLDRVGGI